MEEIILSKDTSEEELSCQYKYGFVTEIDSDIVPKGLDEDVIRLISSKKEEPEFLLELSLIHI